MTGCPASRRQWGSKEEALETIGTRAPDPFEAGPHLACGNPAPWSGQRELTSFQVRRPVRFRPSDVNATDAIWATSIPYADSSTICDRRHVTTDPDDRRTIRNNRLPSSFEISRTLSLSLIHRSKQTNSPKWWTRPPNVGCCGTSRGSSLDLTLIGPIEAINPARPEESVC